MVLWTDPYGSAPKWRLARLWQRNFGADPKRRLRLHLVHVRPDEDVEDALHRICAECGREPRRCELEILDF